MHKTLGQRDPAAAFPLAHARDDAAERRQANRAIAVSAIGLGATGLVELLLAILTGSVGLLGDAIHNLSDVSTSAVVGEVLPIGEPLPIEDGPYLAFEYIGAADYLGEAKPGIARERGRLTRERSHWYGPASTRRTG